MSDPLALLLGGAALVAVVHTVTGPDHYVPFIAMARAGRWSRARAAWITVACGLGHVIGSVVLAWIGVAAAREVTGILAIESWRGEIASWGLIAFGLLYGAWGLRRAIRRRPHGHWHAHPDGTIHSHGHVHEGEHLHPHPSPARSMTPWMLFAIFVFGPCEPLIPLLMYPAMDGRLAQAAWVMLVFSAVTVATMVVIVAGAVTGLARLPLEGLDRYAHALAGAAVLACGLGIRFLGL